MPKQEQGSITPKDLCVRLGLPLDGKRFRSFMRAQARGGAKGVAQPVGQGNTYRMTKAQADAIVKLYLASHPKATDKDARKRTPKAPSTPMPEAHAPEADSTPSSTPSSTQDDA